MLVINIILTLITITESFNETLIMTHLMFRHGNRYPESMLPTNALFNSTFYPYGQGQLSLKGKKSMYNLGKLLRKRYGSFIGQYDPTLFEALSSGHNRNRLSMQLVLAGLFPPESSDFDEDINWQPIDYDYIVQHDDKMLGPWNCLPILYLANVNETNENHTELFDYLSFHTGVQIVSKNQVYYIYDALFCQEDVDLELPNWAKPIWPEPLTKVAHLYISMIIENLKNYEIGNFLKKLITDTNSQTNTNKFILYSAHDINLMFLLGALDEFDGIHSKYGSYMSFEIHNIEGEKYIKVLYENYSDLEPKIINIKDCGQICLFDTFALLMEKYFPQDWCPYDRILINGYYLIPKPKDNLIYKTLIP